MIAVKLEGRLGNQMFQYAFIYAASKKLNTRFYMDKSVDYLLLDKYFNIETDLCRIFDNYLFSINGFKLIFSHYSRWAFYALLKRSFFAQPVIFSNTVSPATQLDKLRNKNIYEGYFQSEDYFIDYKTDIKKLFSIKDTYKIQFKDLFKLLPKAKKYVVIHIRRGDYVQTGCVLDISYYRNTIKEIHHPDNYYIFISDDAGFVKNEFNYLTNKYVSENTEIIDLQFLIYADICILSNSSFSWWGAYLNSKKAQIIAPRYWLGNEIEYPVNIVPDYWVKH